VEDAADPAEDDDADGAGLGPETAGGPDAGTAIIDARKKNRNAGHGGANSASGNHKSHFKLNQRRDPEGKWVNEGRGEGSEKGENHVGAPTAVSKPAEVLTLGQPKPLAGRKLEAVRAYTGPYYKMLNDFARKPALQKPRFNELEHKIWKALNRVLNNAVFPEKITLYRSFDALGTPYARSKVKVGMTITEYGFMSTSRKEKQTSIFKKFAEMPITLKIHVEPGAKALDVARYSPFPDQEEVLFARGSLLKVLSITDNPDYFELEVMYVGQNKKIKQDAAPTADAGMNTPVDEDELFGDPELDDDPEFLRWLHEVAYAPLPPDYDPWERFHTDGEGWELDYSEASGDFIDFTKTLRYQQILKERAEEAAAAKAAAEAKDKPKD